MGGAERSERRRRQARTSGARAVAQARGGGAQKKTIAVVVGVVLLAAAVIIGVLLTNSAKNETAEQPIPTQSTETPVAAGVTETRDGTAVLVGKPGAAATIDIYADFLCPVCGNFEKTFGPQIRDKVNAGTLAVRYHMVPLLNERSDPPGYSLDSANAALLAADAGKFTVFHDALYAAQPEEGKRGYDRNQLATLGQTLGITDPAFGTGVQNGTYNAQLTAALQQASNDPALQQEQQGQTFFGTPTVTAGGKVVQLEQGWLDRIAP